jgi:hypothetical protein
MQDQMRLRRVTASDINNLGDDGGSARMRPTQEEAVRVRERPCWAVFHRRLFGTAARRRSDKGRRRRQNDSRKTNVRVLIRSPRKSLFEANALTVHLVDVGSFGKEAAGISAAATRGVGGVVK